MTCQILLVLTLSAYNPPKSCAAVAIFIFSSKIVVKFLLKFLIQKGDLSENRLSEFELA